MYPTVCPLHGPDLGCGEIFRGIFPFLITLCQPILSQEMAQSPPQWYHATVPCNGTMQPVDTGEQGQCPTMDRQWLNAERKTEPCFEIDYISFD